MPYPFGRPLCIGYPVYIPNIIPLAEGDVSLEFVTFFRYKVMSRTLDSVALQASHMRGSPNWGAPDDTHVMANPPLLQKETVSNWVRDIFCCLSYRQKKAFHGKREHHMASTLVARVGADANGTPIFIIAGQSTELERPFGATSDTANGIWMYPAYFPVMELVLEDFSVLGVTVELSDKAKEHVETMRRHANACRDLVIPEGFRFATTPYPHQIEGLCHIFYKLRSALFYAPGLGKSKIAIDLVRLLKYVGQPHRTLILGPLVTIRNWGAEIDMHAGGELRWQAMLGAPEEKMTEVDAAAVNPPDIFLVTYDTAKRYVDALIEKVPYVNIIADESHYIKEWSSGRTKTAFQLGQKARRKIVMTGTPTLGDPGDLYGQFKFLAHYFMPEPMYKFKSIFYEISPTNKYSVLGYKNLDVLNRRVQRVSLRKTKEECLGDLLPERMPPIDVRFDLSRDQVVAYNTAIAETDLDITTLLKALDTIVSGMGDSYIIPQIAVLLNKLSQIRSGFVLTSNKSLGICNNCEHQERCRKEDIPPYSKECVVAPREPPPTLTVFNVNPALDALEELLGTILGAGLTTSKTALPGFTMPPNKVIIWAVYHAELDMIEARLKEMGIGYVRVDGKTGDRVYETAERFNKEPGLRVYLGQISTGVGITLNAANYMVYYSLSYSLGDYLQSMDRNYRIGQERQVTVYRLFGTQAIDNRIAKLLDSKVVIDGVLTIPSDSVPKKLDRAVVRARLIAEKK